MNTTTAFMVTEVVLHDMLTYLTLCKLTSGEYIVGSGLFRGDLVTPAKRLYYRGMNLDNARRKFYEVTREPRGDS